MAAVTLKRTASTKRAFAIYNSVLVKSLTQVPGSYTTPSHLFENNSPLLRDEAVPEGSVRPLIHD